MKLSAALLLIAFLHASANSDGQVRITLTEKNASLEKVFHDIQAQSGYIVWCNTDLLRQAPRVTLQLTDVPIEQALTECLKGQPLQYSIQEKIIVITKKDQPPTPTPTGGDPLIDVKGKVTNEKGEPLSGASILVKGTHKGAQTDKDGNYELQQIASQSILHVSYTGYSDQEVSLQGKNFLAIALLLSTNPLDAIQVIAYGTTTKRFNTSSITTIKAEDIEKQPVSNPILALEGRAPGLFITQSNGIAGGGVATRLQGQTSISATNGNDPLYVIDGVPYVSQTLFTTKGGMTNGGILGTSGGSTTSGGGSPLSYINPSDIESIEILKDADATAIYGSRAENGAILITTKKGKIGQASLNINLQKGIGQVARKVNLLNTVQYLQMRHEAFKNDGASIGTTDYDINGLWDSTRNTDWQKSLIGANSQYENLYGSVEGGNILSQYLVGATYHKETTVFPGNFSDQRANVYFNINSISFNRRFKLQFSGNYMFDNNLLPGNDLTGIATSLAPDAPSLYNRDGTLNWAPTASGASSWTNPLANINTSYNSKSNNLLSSALLSYLILPGLEIKSSFGYTNLQINEFQGLPITFRAPEARSSAPRIAYYSKSNITTWIIEPQLTYNREFGKAKLDLLAGYSDQHRNNDGAFLMGVGYSNDQVMSDIKSASSVTINNTDYSVYKYNGLFGRANLNWDKKYILNFTARRDGSSRFGPNNQFHSFASLGAAWLFSEEHLSLNAFKWMSFGKLRVTYGTTGNDQIPDYSFMNLYTTLNPGNPYQGTAGLVSTGLANPYLAWEETKKLEMGMDIGFLQNRIMLTTDFIINRSSNELLGYSLPTVTGFSGITENYPATVQNTAWEFTLNASNGKGHLILWTANINLTIPRNKIVSFPGLANSTQANSIVIGQPIGVRKLFHYLGVNPTTGIFQFEDQHGNTTSAPVLSDETALINTLPRFYGGIKNELQFKNISLSFLFQFVKQTGYYVPFRGVPGRFLSGANNQPVGVLNRWQKPNDIAVNQKFTQNTSLNSYASYYSASDAAFQDASFVRLKNISISYTFSKSRFVSRHIGTFRLFMQAQNLITFTRYKGLDPENQSVISLPPLRVILAGLQITL